MHHRCDCVDFELKTTWAVVVDTNESARAPKITKVTLNFRACCSQSQLCFIVFGEKIMKLHICNMPVIIIS